MLEFIQAILFTNKSILDKSGNWDLYYLFSVGILCFSLKKSKFLCDIIRYYIPFLILGIFMLVCYPHINYLKCCIYLAKLFLNIVLMVYTMTIFSQMRKEKLLTYICLILGLETFLAFILPGENVMWRYHDLINRFTETRLQLFCLEPSDLSFHCGILFLCLFYLFVFKRERNIRYIGCAIVVLADLLLSAGLSGIAAAFFSVAVILFYSSLEYLWRCCVRGVTLSLHSSCLTAMVILCLILVLLQCNGPIMQRVNAVFSGKDSSTISRIVMPLKVLGPTLKKTHLLGLGFGNMRTEYGLSIMEMPFIFPNSILYFIAEAGLGAILIIVAFTIFLLRQCIRKRDFLALMLLAYIFIFQLIGGYFTDPVNYLIYGIILSRSSLPQSDRDFGMK